MRVGVVRDIFTSSRPLINLEFLAIQRMVSSFVRIYTPSELFTGTIRLWQTTPGKTYGLWQGQNPNGN